MTRRHPVSKNAVAAVCPAPVLPFNAGKREIRAIIKKIKEGKRWTIQRIEHRPAKLVTISPRTIRRYHFFEENLFQSESSKDPYVRAFHHVQRGIRNERSSNVRGDPRTKNLEASIIKVVISCIYYILLRDERLSSDFSSTPCREGD